MGRQEVLAEPVLDYAERKVRIEADPLPKNIGDLIDQAAAEAGDKLLWNFFEAGETITYDQMRRKGNGLAAKLLDLGITKGTHVGVMLPNIPALPLTWLALGRIGAVMLPINNAYKARELEHVMTTAEGRWIVSHADCLPVVEEVVDAGAIDVTPDRVITVGMDDEPYLKWEDLSDTPLDRFDAPEPVTHDDLLNIQFTSGTSGFPKGCRLTQRYWVSSGKVNAFRDGRRYERILASTPFFYMDPQWLLLMTMYHRGTLFVAAKQSTSRFLGWLRMYRIQFCLFPWVLLNQPARPDDNENEIVRCNVYGVPKDLHPKLEARFDVNAREAFGMTELGPAMFVPVERPDKVGSGSCGLPCPFRECRIVDEAGQEVPRGEIGELQVRGPGIMGGYYNNPKATEEVFDGDWFRTGDLFRQDDEGFFYIVGRKKDMIRRSAENIAAREVETVLSAAEAVAECAVVGVPDDLRGEEVKAYLRLKPGVEPDEVVIEEVIAVATQGLAPFKVPRFYAFVDDFPRTASLKIAKPQITQGVTDLRAGSFDRVAGQWVGSETA
ncbi:MAG: AMP-binding protein [Rhodobacteraceae bacterium]|nr:AMP-binding protein [Paracoccaceae bacterium]